MLYHILPCWLNMIRIVVVNKDRDIFGFIMVDVCTTLRRLSLWWKEKDVNDTTHLSEVLSFA